MKLYTTEEIAEKLNLKRRTVLYRFERLGIKGKRKIRQDYFTQEQVDLISVKKNKIPSFPLYSDNAFYEKQIQVIEYWQNQIKKNNREIAKHLNINEISVCRIVKLFVKRECIIVQSKINKL